MVVGMTITQLTNKHHHNGEPFALPTAVDLWIFPIQCREPLLKGTTDGALAGFSINSFALIRIRAGGTKNIRLCRFCTVGIVQYWGRRPTQKKNTNITTTVSLSPPLRCGFNGLPASDTWAAIRRGWTVFDESLSARRSPLARRQKWWPKRHP